MKSCPLCNASFPDEQTICAKDGTVLVQRREIGPGTVIRGKYRIERLIGRGGMGTVYLATHILLEQKVALKFIATALSQDGPFVSRFRREAQVTVMLHHPNLAQVLDLDQSEDGLLYIAMEFVEGPSLRRLMTGGPLEVDRALKIARGVAEGLGAAHARGIIHRDVKPENVLLDTRSSEIPKLLDFGIAAMKWDAGSSNQTRGLILSPEYAAPEQWRGTPAGQLDGRVDLYALGSVLDEMLTGKPCFHAENAEGWMYQHLMAEPARPSKLRPELTNWPGLDELVMRLLAKNREDRPRDVSEFIKQVDALYERAPASFAAAPAGPEKASFAIEPAPAPRAAASAPAAIPELPGSVTQLGVLAAPTGFFASTAVSHTSFFEGDQVRYRKVQETLSFYRDLLKEEYKFLSSQARLTYYLWVAAVVLGLICLVTGIVLLFLQKFAAGSVSIVSTAFVGFIYKVFQQREDHYRALATAKREHLEYGNHWLLVIQSIDAIDSREERERSQRRLVDVLTNKLGSSDSRPQPRSRTAARAKKQAS